MFLAMISRRLAPPRIIMTKEAKELITKQKKLFIKINTRALNDIEDVSIDCHLALYIIAN
jgi:hypothetical protein